MNVADGSTGDALPQRESGRATRGRLVFRLSVRALMVLVLLIGGGAGWVVHRARVQKEAVAAIEQAGGRVVYDWAWKDGHPAPRGAKPAWPKRLVDTVGPDYFGNVVAVYPAKSTDDTLMLHIGQLRSLQLLNLNGRKSVTDLGLVHLRGLTELRELDLSFTGATGSGLKSLERMTRLRKLVLPTGPISDDDLAHLGGLTGLEWLQAGSTQRGITDAGLAHLKGLVNLKVLSLHSPRITSSGLAALRGMSRLEMLTLGRTGVDDLAPIGHLTGLTSLSLSATPIDDAGLAPVARMSGLRSLHLEHTQITDAGLVHLRGLKAMAILSLDHTRITDAGLEHIAGLTNLENLWLNHTAISDRGLPRLAALNKLTLLFVEGTQVTDAGLANLAGLKALEQVAVSKTGVTDAGIAAAQRNRPGTRFVRMGF